MRASQGFTAKEASFAKGTSRNLAETKKLVMSTISKDEFDFDKYYLIRTSSAVEAIELVSNQIYDLIASKVAATGYQPLTGAATNQNRVHMLDDLVMGTMPNFKRFDGQYRSWYSQARARHLKRYEKDIFAASHVYQAANMPHDNVRLISSMPGTGIELITEMGTHVNGVNTAAQTVICNLLTQSGNSQLYREIMDPGYGTRATAGLPISFDLRTSEYQNGMITGPFKLLVQDQSELVLVTGIYTMQVGGHGTISRVQTKSLGNMNTLSAQLAQWDPDIKLRQTVFTIPDDVARREYIDQNSRHVKIELFEYTEFDEHGPADRAGVYAITSADD